MHFHLLSTDPTSVGSGFSCGDADNCFLPSFFVCNGNVECPNGVDELNCGKCMLTLSYDILSHFIDCNYLIFFQSGNVFFRFCVSYCWSRYIHAIVSG